VSDRDYLRADFEGGGFRPSFWATWPVTKALLIAFGAVYLAFLMVRAGSLSAAQSLADHLWLWPDRVLRGFEIWQLLTYALFHDPYDLWHLLFNAYATFLFGRMVEERLAPRPTALFCLGATLTAAFAYLLESVVLQNRAPMIGASGCVLGLTVLAACWFPRRQLLIFFILPMPLWVVAVLVVFIDLALLLRMDGGIAHSAHLGGALYAWIYFRYGGGFGSIFAGIDRMAERRRQAKKTKRAEKDADLRREVDRILDKVNREGMPALTDEERRFLKQASEKLRR